MNNSVGEFNTFVFVFEEEEVELLFRKLKAQYRLDKSDTAKKHAVEILLYATLLSSIESRELLDLVVEHAADGLVFPPESRAVTFRSHAHFILHELDDTLATLRYRC